jgi:AcrR family transcriptional regulator
MMVARRDQSGVRMSVQPVSGSDVRVRILDIAANAFMRRGFSATTIDDIADEVGATKGLIYYHFRSKLDIFLAVYEEGMRRVSARVAPLAGLPGSGRVRLTAMSIAHVENLMTDLGYHNVIHQGVREQTSAALKAHHRDQLLALNELRSDYETLFGDVVADGMSDGSLRPLDGRLVTRTLLSNLNAVDMWYHPIDGQTDHDIRALATRIVDIVIGGVAAGAVSSTEEREDAQ